MSHKGLSEPHVLLASSNPFKLIRNLKAILATGQLKKIDKAISAEATLLFELGASHFTFAKTVPNAEWRQKISRLYYAAYNVKRAVALRYDGSFGTDSKDHGTVDQLPTALVNHATYSGKLKNLREDRNLADYSHLAKEGDLIIPVKDAETLVSGFMNDARVYLISKGVSL